MHALFPTPGGGKTPLPCAEIQNTHTHTHGVTHPEYAGIPLPKHISF